MKVLVLSNLFPPHYIGGYELRCLRITEALRRRGHKVHVLTSRHGLPPGPSAAPADGVERSLRIHGFFGHPWLGINALRDLEFHNNDTLRAVVERIQPDVVHVWNLGGLSKSMIITLARLGVPTIYDVSDHWIARSLKADVWMDWWNRTVPSASARLLRAIWTATGRRRTWDLRAPTNPVRHVRFPRVYFCSGALRDLTVKAGYPVGHGSVIYCSVDLDRFHGTPAPVNHPVRKLLCVGRLAEDKGTMTALRAMRAVHGRFDGELHVYGKGDADYTAVLKAYVHEHQLPVTFASASEADMPSVYRNHDALLFTSEWEEPFALTPLEAMASGLPVIGTTTGGSKELLRDGENALTYAAGDADALARCIIKLDADPQRRVSLAEAGQAEVSSRCAEPVIVDQIESFLLDTVRTWTPSCPPAYGAP